MHTTISDQFRLTCMAIAGRLAETRSDDRGETNSSVAWAGAMVVLVATVAVTIAAKAEGFAPGIDLGP